MTLPQLSAVYGHISVCCYYYYGFREGPQPHVHVTCVSSLCFGCFFGFSLC